MYLHVKQRMFIAGNEQISGPTEDEYISQSVILILLHIVS